MNHITGHFSLLTGVLCDTSGCAFSFENERVLIRLLGHLGGMDKTSMGPMLSDLYASYNIEMTSHLSGVYLLMLYDKVKHSLQFFHGLSTYSQFLYYTVNNDNLYYSTSLKYLLANSRILRKLDDDGLRELLSNGYVTGSKTIVQNVFKLEPFKSLLAENAVIKQIPTNYTVKSIDEDEAKEMWNPALERAIIQSAAGEEEINVTLSSGFDSNYILHVFSHKVNVPINAFSVGGRSGRNELPLVEKIVSNYDNVYLHKAYTDSNFLQYLPDIAWRLEGAVYEIGIFLQYALSLLLNKEKKTSLICGECADQVMNKWYLDNVRLEGRGISALHSINGLYNLTNKQYPYLYGNNLVLKKNGILANSFDIDVRYPYLDDDFISVANALGVQNGTKKKYHKYNCNQILNPDVLSNLSKIGGSTDVHSMFGSASEMGNFISRVKKTNFYKSHSGLLHNICTVPAGENILRRTLSLIPNSIDISRTRLGRESYKRTEIALRQYLGYVYIDIFNHLILSGQYDYLFESDGVDISLEDII